MVPQSHWNDKAFAVCDSHCFQQLFWSHSAWYQNVYVCQYEAIFLCLTKQNTATRANKARETQIFLFAPYVIRLFVFVPFAILLSLGVYDCFTQNRIFVQNSITPPSTNCRTETPPPHLFVPAARKMSPKCTCKCTSFVLCAKLCKLFCCRATSFFGSGLWSSKK